MEKRSGHCDKIMAGLECKIQGMTRGLRFQMQGLILVRKSDEQKQ